jgi:hypothetical protein
VVDMLLKRLALAGPLRYGVVCSAYLMEKKAAQGLMLNRSGALAADGKVDLVVFQLSSGVGTVWR